MSYATQERRRLLQLLARLTAGQRARYEAQCRLERQRRRKLFDAAKAEIAEGILYADTPKRGSEA